MERPRLDVLRSFSHVAAPFRTSPRPDEQYREQAHSYNVGNPRDLPTRNENNRRRPLSYSLRNSNRRSSANAPRGLVRYSYNTAESDGLQANDDDYPSTGFDDYASQRDLRDVEQASNSSRADRDLDDFYNIPNRHPPSPISDPMELSDYENAQEASSAPREVEDESFTDYLSESRYRDDGLGPGYFRSRYEMRRESPYSDPIEVPSHSRRARETSFYPRNSRDSFLTDDMSDTRGGEEAPDAGHARRRRHRRREPSYLDPSGSDEERSHSHEAATHRSPRHRRPVRVHTRRSAGGGHHSGQGHAPSRPMS